MQDAKRELRDRLWTLSNLIVGFAVLQAVASVFVVIQNPGLISCWAKKIGLSWESYNVFVFGGGSLAYAAALALCRWLASTTGVTELVPFERVLFWARILVVVAFNIIPILVVYQAVTLFDPVCPGS